MPLEDAVDVVHPALHFVSFRRGERGVGVEQAGVGAAAVESQVMPTLFHMPVVANLPPTTPIEAVIVVASAKIVSAPHRNVVAAAAGNIAHRDHQRLLGLDPQRGVENDLAGHRGAARRVDPQHHALHVLVFRDLVHAPCGWACCKPRFPG